MKDILNADYVKETVRMLENMYRLGWDERNGGNVSALLEEKDVAPYLDINKVIREINIGFDAKELAGKYFLVTGTGKYFKNASVSPDSVLGLFRISPDGGKAQLLWGYSDGGRFTSELPSHLMCHMARLKKDPLNRIIMHCHPTNLLALTRIMNQSDAAFTDSLWRTSTECVVVFPEGIGTLPWMVCGNNEIGIATAKKMEEFRLVMWWLHGVYGAGKNLDEAFGLIETAEKSAQLIILTQSANAVNEITNEQLDALTNAFGIKYRKDLLIK